MSAFLIYWKGALSWAATSCGLISHMRIMLPLKEHRTQKKWNLVKWTSFFSKQLLFSATALSITLWQLLKFVDPMNQDVICNLFVLQCHWLCSCLICLPHCKGWAIRKQGCPYSSGPGAEKKWRGTKASEIEQRPINFQQDMALFEWARHWLIEPSWDCSITQASGCCWKRIM